MAKPEIKLKVIGCGDAFGSGGRLNTCFYLQSPKINLLIDCGATVLPALKQQNLSVEQVDAVVISHFHGDHYGGIPYLLLEAAITRRQKKLTIITPEGGKSKVVALLDLLYPQTPVLEHLDVDFITYRQSEPLHTAHFSLTAFEVIHSKAALPHGLRISIQNKVISYSGDTSWTTALIALSAGADLFICESNFFRTQVKGHLNYLELKAKLSDLSCKHMLLTHFDQEMLHELANVELDCAIDGMELIIS